MLKPQSRHSLVTLDGRGQWEGATGVLAAVVLVGVMIGFFVWDAKTNRVPARDLYGTAAVLAAGVMACTVYGFACVWLAGTVATVDRAAARVFLSRRAASTIGVSRPIPLWSRKLSAGEHALSSCELRLYRGRYVSYRRAGLADEKHGWVVTLSVPGDALFGAFTSDEARARSYVDDLQRLTGLAFRDTGCTLAWRNVRR